MTIRLEAITALAALLLVALSVSSCRTMSADSASAVTEAALCNDDEGEFMGGFADSADGVNRTVDYAVCQNFETQERRVRRLMVKGIAGIANGGEVDLTATLHSALSACKNSPATS